MIEALEEEQAHQIDYINENVLKIYELLDEVANGKRSLNVRVAGYGLTSAGGNTTLLNAQGGVGGQLNISNNTNSSILSGGFSSGSGSSGVSGGGSISNGSSASGGDSFSGGSVGFGSSGGGNTPSGNNGSSSYNYTVSAGLDLGGWTVL
jgi:hypothetical protein